MNNFSSTITDDYSFTKEKSFTSGKIEDYGYKTLAQVGVEIPERKEYGLDDFQIRKGFELGLTIKELQGVEMRQIQGRKILSKIHNIPPDIQDILTEIYDSLQHDVANIKTLPSRIKDNISLIIKEILPKNVIINNYHIGISFYDTTYDAGYRAQKILFLLSLWQKFPEIFGKFHTEKTVKKESKLAYGYHPFLISRILISDTFDGFYKYAPDILSSRNMKKYSDPLKLKYNFSFLGYDPSMHIKKHKDLLMLWFKEILIIGGLTLTHGRLQHPSFQNIWNIFLTDIIDSYQKKNIDIRNLAIEQEISRIHGADFLPQIYDIYEKLSCENLLPKVQDIPLEPVKKRTKKPKRKPNSVIVSDPIPQVSRGEITIVGNQELHFSYPYTGEILIEHHGVTHTLPMILGVCNISEIITPDISESDVSLSLRFSDTSEYGDGSYDVVILSPVLQFLRTHSPVLEGHHKYDFERGDITNKTINSISLEGHDQDVAIRIEKDDMIYLMNQEQIIDNLPNGKYIFRYFLRKNPEIVSKPSTYTRNNKPTEGLTQTVQKKVIQSIKPPETPNHENILQQKFEEDLINFLDTGKIISTEVDETHYHIFLGDDQNISLHYDFVTNNWRLISPTDIELSDEYKELLFSEIMEPIFAGIVEQKKSKIEKEVTLLHSELLRMRKYFRREFESYSLEKDISSFPLLIDSMMKRDARSEIIGYMGYSVWAFGQAKMIQEHIDNHMSGITVATDVKNKILIITLEKGEKNISIKSTKIAPYYEIFENGFGTEESETRALFGQTIRYLYLLLGAMFNGKKKMRDYTSRVEKDLIQDVYRRLKEGEGKIEINGGWYDGDWYESKIQSKQSLENIRNLEDIRIILHDETIACVEKGKGQKDVYRRIAEIPRLQKYLLNRIVATIRKEKYKNKSPLTGDMADVFWRFWDSLSSEEREGFVQIFANTDLGNTDRALEYGLKNGANLFESFLHSAESSGVELIYRSAQMIDADEFLSIVEREQK